MENKIKLLKNVVSDEKQYAQLLCYDNPNIILKTEYGIGHYKFVEFKEINSNMVLEFKLQNDSHYKDTDNINNHIGNLCLLTIGQFLYVHCNLAYA